MITTGNRLAFLSGLSGVPAYQHLRQIAGFYGIAAAMLVAFSGYPTAPAWVHLFPPESQESASAGGRISPEWSPSEKRRKAIEEALRAQPLSDADRDVVGRALFAFFAAGGASDSAEGREAIRSFLDSTVARLRRADLKRRAASQQFAEDHLDAIAQQRIDNRRRAVILVALLMLMN